MRQLALILALSVVGCLGCTTDDVHPSSWLSHRRPLQGPTGPDVVQMRFAIIECRLGEAEWSYINGELWQVADESLIDEDRRQAMNESGFRVGKIGALPPAPLLTMLTSKRFNPSPRELEFRSSDPRPLPIGSTLPQCRYQLERDGTPIEVNQADCKLIIAASQATGGKTMLHLTPQVVHGATKRDWLPDPQTGSFQLTPERPSETYTAMSWDAELAPNEYLIVGGNYDRPETLGHQFFLRPDEAQPVQRLLVIQMGIAPAAPPVEMASTQPGSSRPRAVPLALQATWPAARGAAP
jgi:hypothetical protein